MGNETQEGKPDGYAKCDHCKTRRPPLQLMKVVTKTEIKIGESMATETHTVLRCRDSKLCGRLRRTTKGRDTK